MKRTFAFSALAFICCAMAAFAADPPAPATAVSGKPCPVVAVLDMNKIMRESKLAQRLQSRLQGLDESIKQQLGPMMEAYQKHQSDFDSAKGTLSPEKRASEESSLNDEQRQLSAAQQQAQQAFGQQRDALAKQMREHLVPAVEAIAREKGWDIVMTRNGADVIWASDAVDGSSEVIAKLNAEPLPSGTAGETTAPALPQPPPAASTPQPKEPSPAKH